MKKMQGKPPWEAISAAIAVVAIFVGAVGAVAVPEIRRFIGLDHSSTPEVAPSESSRAASVRRLGTATVLVPNLPKEIFPNFFVTYVRERPENTIWQPADRGVLRIQKDERADSESVAIWNGAVLRISGSTQDTVFLVSEITENHVTIN
jgi:hypothetical protein